MGGMQWRLPPLLLSVGRLQRLLDPFLVLLYRHRVDPKKTETGPSYGGPWHNSVLLKFRETPPLSRAAGL